MLNRMKAARALLVVLGFLSFGANAADEAPDLTESADTLERIKARGLFTACADPYSYPQSTQEGDPPGFDVELFRAIAKGAGLRYTVQWINTASRGGTGRAFRQSILAKKCDVFLGMSDSGDDDMLMGKLAFTKPFLGVGYVLVTQGKAAGMKTLDELKQANVKVGVSMSTPMDDYLFMNKIPRELYMGSQRMIDGMLKGDVDASMMFSTNLGVIRSQKADSKIHMADGYVPPEGLRYNSNWIVRKADKSLLAFLNEGLDTLLANGKVKEIVESYGVPFYPPFPQ